MCSNVLVKKKGFVSTKMKHFTEGISKYLLEECNLNRKSQTWPECRPSKTISKKENTTSAIRLFFDANGDAYGLKALERDKYKTWL